jgi:hypothetical protein
MLEDSGSLAAERLFYNIAARRALSNLSLVLGTGRVGFTTLFSKEADPRSGSMAGSSADFLTGFPLMK